MFNRGIPSSPPQLGRFHSQEEGITPSSPRKASKQVAFEVNTAKEVFKVVWFVWIFVVVVAVWRYTSPKMVDSSIDVIKFLEGQKPLPSLPVFSYDSKTSQWLPNFPGASNIPEYETAVRVSSLKFITYNIWFGTRRETREELAPRYNALFEIIREQEPDVVCLQEMTAPAMGILLDTPWVREKYWVSDSYQPTTFGGYGVVILSKLPCLNLRLVSLPTRLGRKVLVAEFKINGEIFAVATSHLESYPHDSAYRAQQLQVIFHLLSEYKHAALMGDFNFANSNEREDTVSRSNYTDLWKAVTAMNPGFTFDGTLNKMTQMLTGSTERNRIDLILLRSTANKWKGLSAMLLGTEPIASIPGQVVFPSDHFGVAGSIFWIE